ncbi:MAG: hypothetical protein Q3990_06275 [Desulfovibrionaceae bacterium]|nr:hypothetical protein [Desulfovibrionaceae bacterium]
MSQQIIVVAIIAACVIGLIVHFRKSIKSKSCSCCGSRGSKGGCHCQK